MKTTDLLFIMIDHHVMRLYITMHNTLAVTEVQRLQELIDIKTDVKVGEARVQGSEVRVVDIFEDQTRRFALVVAHHIQQCYDIGTARQILENLDLTFNLLLLDRLKNLDNTLLVVDDINTLEHFGILSAACGVIISSDCFNDRKD